MNPNPTTNPTAIGRGLPADVRIESGRVDVLTGWAIDSDCVIYTHPIAAERPTNDHAIFAHVVTTSAASDHRRSAVRR